MGGIVLLTSNSLILQCSSRLKLVLGVFNFFSHAARNIRVCTFCLINYSPSEIQILLFSSCFFHLVLLFLLLFPLLFFSSSSTSCLLLLRVRDLKSTVQQEILLKA